MHEIARVSLENDMDLILGHRRTMKLGELTGLSLAAQTTFATAVSEVSRATLEDNKGGQLILAVSTNKRENYLVAILKLVNEKIEEGFIIDGYERAKRLVSKHSISTQGKDSFIHLYFNISSQQRWDIQKLDELRNFFRNEPPLSPYDEIKRKNEQLQELSDKLQKSEEQYQILTNSLPLIIFSVFPNGELLYSNEWLPKYTGIYPSEGKFSWETVIHPDDLVLFQPATRLSAMDGDDSYRAQLRLKNKYDFYLWHQLVLTPFLNNDAKLFYWIGYMVDIDSHKLYEQTIRDNVELKQAQAELSGQKKALEKNVIDLNRSNEELQQFAFIASHDLQEPMRKLIFYSDMLIKKYADSLDDKAKDILSSMQNSSLRMRDLIRDLLSFSQINREQINFQQVDLNLVVNDVLTDMELTIQEKEVIVNMGQLPDMKGDLRMMRQLFFNLLNNALKYSRPGTRPVINIHSRVCGSSTEISISDNGIGFNEMYLPQIFTLFKRLHTQEQYKGTGLGLAICRKIVELHDGKIWATGTEGKGATFYISLPNELQMTE